MALHYFVSDVHLGLDCNDPLERERRFVSFLKELPEETESLFLLGDIFDFWYEYKYVVPAGHVRVLGALAELSDKGVRVFFFRGNHDLWTFGYLEREIGLKVLEQPCFMEIDGKVFCMGHGDGVGKTDLGFRLLRSVFYSRFAQRLFSSIHPRWAMALGYGWSRHNRTSRQSGFLSASSLPLFGYTSSLLKERHVDYFVFGHYHAPQILDMPDSNSKLCVLGDWVSGTGAAVFDGSALRLIG